MASITDRLPKSGEALEDVRPACPAAPYLGGRRFLPRRLCALIATIPHRTYLEPLVGMGGVFLRRKLMRKRRLATISLVYAETPHCFDVRNPFAAGGVYENLATGAAAAALAGYLQPNGVGEGANIEIVQGEDMGVPCLIRATAPVHSGSGARVYAMVRRNNVAG